MADEWRNYRIRDLGDLVTGRTPPGTAEHFFGDGIPFLTPTDMDGHRRVKKTVRSLSTTGAQLLKRVLVPHGVAVSCIGWQMGKSVLIDHPTITNQQVNSIVTNPKVVDDLFLYYQLSSRRKEIFALGAGGSRTPILKKSAFGDIAVALPPLPEQRAIADILGTLDDKIELNRRMNETLEAIAPALFKSWFVDFDPVRAKAEGRAPGLPPDLAALFPDRLEDSELGEIPRGWRTSTIGQATICVGGSTPSTKDPRFWGGEIAFATPKDLASLSSPVLLRTERCITEQGVSQISSGVLPAGTVLLSSRAPIGYLAVAGIPVSVNQGFIAIKCEKDLPNYYVLEWAKANMDIIVSQANGTTFLEVSKSAFRPIPVVVPAKPVLDSFVGLVQPLHKRVVSNLRENETLATLRDALLPKLISGELRIAAPTGSPS